MAITNNMSDFLNENKKLVKEYLEARIEIYKLRFIYSFARVAGSLLWIIICLFLMFLLILFLGLVVGFWLSELTGSYTKGFALATLVMLFIIVVAAAMRNVLFIDPIIKKCIHKIRDEPIKKYTE